ncbi:MAG: type II toxin-antitoxin system prevent-host-death family antitoxin [Lachnospiraceae bacterium]|nr:type II toxin-antitoxin system prevent-host-death family antitoxin [Lachnospiraceae bacterium]
MTTATAKDIQNNFRKYLQMVQAGGEVIVLENGKEVARLVSHNKSVSFLTDSLVGILKGDYDDKASELERVTKHEDID